MKSGERCDIICENKTVKVLPPPAVRSGDGKGERMPIPERRVANFEQMAFGMFIHWGLYSQLGTGEWTLEVHKRDRAEYEGLRDSFTAEHFDADAIVSMAKAAGCRYITLTTRHHEGFSLYDTCGLNTYDAPHSAAGRDLVAEFVAACARQDVLPFFYHTTLDWYNPDFNGDFDKYLEYLRKSVEILCTNYGPIGGLWFDGDWSRPGADWKHDELYGTIRRLQPEAMIINNTGMGARGRLVHPEIDAVTFEQGRPTPMDRRGMDKYVSAEMCCTLNDHWGVGLCDFNYKSPRELIETLCDCRRVGANLLLNIGPTAQGGVLPMQRELMATLGAWMDIFGEAVYNGRPYPSHCAGRSFVLKGKDCLYIFAYDLGQKGHENVTVASKNYCGVYAFSGISDSIARVCWMDNGEELAFTQQGDSLTVNLTGNPYGTGYCVRVARAELK